MVQVVTMVPHMNYMGMITLRVMFDGLKKETLNVSDLLSRGILNVKDIVSKRYQITDAINAYSDIKSDWQSLGVIFEFPVDQKE